MTMSRATGEAPGAGRVTGRVESPLLSRRSRIHTVG
jgi:hypothetical protein